MHTFFTTNSSFEKEFQRCCKEYDSLEMFIAWIGDPKAVIPFEYIHGLQKISAVVGVSFSQSHPAGIAMLMNISAEIRIANEYNLFHPKVYIFSNANKRAVFIGSSNFTYQGFYQNLEVNILIEGSSTNKDIFTFENNLRKWYSKDFSTEPTEQWLKRYTERYNKRRQKIKKAGLNDEINKEEQASNASAWLVVADWDLYISKVFKGLHNHSSKYDENLSLKLELFDRFDSEIGIPWKIEYFTHLEKRRLIGGMYPYGWLGHVAASGDFRRILKNGSIYEHKTIVKSINSLALLTLPLDYKKISKILDDLLALGPSMKVWGRLLAIVRPDLFCTISAPSVRKNIAKVLGKAEKHFEGAEGYLMLIQLIHSSPWFNSKAPLNEDELAIWKRRVAFLDVVFYN
jgi:hypothetical protein